MRKRSLNLGVIFLYSLLLIACTKNKSPEMEKFYFYGQYTDFTTGKPIANMKISAKGQIPGTPGIFGISPVIYDLGESSTDANGFFKITPLKINGIKYYFVRPDTDLIYISFLKNITADSIQTNPLPGYNAGCTLNSYGYLKINFNNTVAPDTSDIFSLNVDCPGNISGPGFNSIQYISSPMPMPTELDFFKGIIQNGYAAFRVMGNNTNTFTYFKYNRFGYTTTTRISVFCKANDTTYYTINY